MKFLTLADADAFFDYEKILLDAGTESEGVLVEQAEELLMPCIVDAVLRMEGSCGRLWNRFAWTDGYEVRYLYRSGFREAAARFNRTMIRVNRMLEQHELEQRKEESLEKFREAATHYDWLQIPEGVIKAADFGGGMEAEP